jgi:hypothetical protein
VGHAQTELKRYGLLEVLFERATSVYKKYIRYMNYFRQNPFYDYAARVKGIEGLAKEYGDGTLAVARKIASVLADDSDLENIRVLCGLVKAEGLGRAEAVARGLARLSPCSTCRTIEYACELLGQKRDEWVCHPEPKAKDPVDAAIIPPRQTFAVSRDTW